MKSREIKELHTKSAAELQTMLGEVKSALIAAQLEHAQQKLANTRSLANMRADIARINTVLQTKAEEPAAEGETA